jgi:hypothetical protein
MQICLATLKAINIDFHQMLHFRVRLCIEYMYRKCISTGMRLEAAEVGIGECRSYRLLRLFWKDA